MIQELTTQPNNGTIAGLTIQEVSHQTGLSVHTLRYYERIGLFGHVERAANGHRRYAQEDINAVRFFIRLRATGMPIRQMLLYAELVRQGRQGIDTNEERLNLLEAHREAVEAQIKELEQNLQHINNKIAIYKQGA